MKILVALYDRATEAHAPVMTVHTKGEALRSFREAVNDNQTPIHRNPTDFELWQVGTYDDQSGQITPHRELIARAEDHKE